MNSAYVFMLSDCFIIVVMATSQLFYDFIDLCFLFQLFGLNINESLQAVYVQGSDLSVLLYGE